MKISIMTLFPEMCETVLNESILGRARKKGLFEVECINFRDYADNKHNRVDHILYGGGMGMLLQPEPIYRCYQAIAEKSASRPHVIYLSPQGQTFTQQKARQLLSYDHLVLLCGHYEGVDERVLEEIVDEEISIGDFVVTGGELPALMVCDCILRMCDGVLSDRSCFEDESHYNGLLECPHYTRPPIWHGRAVPQVLQSGHHANIEDWRLQKALERTRLKRPDLYEQYCAEHPEVLLPKKRRRPVRIKEKTLPSGAVGEPQSSVLPGQTPADLQTHSEEGSSIPLKKVSDSEKKHMDI